MNQTIKIFMCPWCQMGMDEGCSAHKEDCPFVGIPNNEITKEMVINIQSD